jgi:hypothetical protein
MIEFTILLDDSDLHFEPAGSSPDLAFSLPPTARIGRDDDTIHLAPIPVHCFFNAMSFGHWVQGEHSISECDAFVTYLTHDIFKALLHLIPSRRNPNSRTWSHQFDNLFQYIEKQFRVQNILDDFGRSFLIIKDHGPGGVPWKEATSYEERIEAGTEKPNKRKRKDDWDWPFVGLTIRLQSALSNALSIAYVKQLFIESYVEAIRVEYTDVFARFDEVSYEYEFVDPTALTGDTDRDIEALCRQSKVEQQGRKLVIHTFIGAHGPHWQTGQDTVVRLPFWLLLTLHSDPVSILFPVPTLYGGGQPLDNPAFVHRVRAGFYERVRSLLLSADVATPRQVKWQARVDEIMADLDQTFHIVHSTDFTVATNARRTDPLVTTQICSMCDSPIPPGFVCSPKTDLGASVSNYTDWHLGDADRACVLCAISQFKTPAVLEPARKLIFQRKVVYFALSTLAARKSSVIARAETPFFTAPGFAPQLDIRSLESLVTLNIIAALYLHDVHRQSVLLYNGEPDLWLEETFPTSPFSFVGEVAKAKNKSGMPAFLGVLFKQLNRPIVLLDPLLPMEIEVPFHTLTCLQGISKGRHYEFKYKPLLVSNETGTLPVIWEGYHFIDQQALEAIQTLQTFVQAFKSHKVTHRMKLTALASSPEEFVNVLIELGGYGYEGVLERLAQLSGGQPPEQYLRKLRIMVQQTPLITELWEEK